MYPTGWGWITVTVGVCLVVAIYLRRRIPKDRLDIRTLAGVGVGFVVLVFLFSFVQWASWYE